MTFSFWQRTPKEDSNFSLASTQSEILSKDSLREMTKSVFSIWNVMLFIMNIIYIFFWGIPNECSLKRKLVICYFDKCLLYKENDNEGVYYYIVMNNCSVNYIMWIFRSFRKLWHTGSQLKDQPTNKQSDIKIHRKETIPIIIWMDLKKRQKELFQNCSFLPNKVLCD